MAGLNRAAWVILLLAVGTRAAAQTVLPLAGVNAVGVEVESPGKDLPQVFTATRLQTLIELKLRGAGLRVLPIALLTNPIVQLSVIGGPVLGQRGSSLGFVFGATMSARQYLVWPKNGAVAPLELWANSYVVTSDSGGAAAELERLVGILLDELINEWLKANPR